MQEKYDKANYPVSDLIEAYLKEQPAVQDVTNSREYSWYLCHGAFKDCLMDEGKEELLSLHLMGYLASWGMYRGDAPLPRSYSYGVHRGLIPILRECASLMDQPARFPAPSDDRFAPCLKEAFEKVQAFYRSVGFVPTDTLVTKILLGVFGCFPAYDVYVKKGLGNYNIQQGGAFDKLSENLFDWFSDNPDFCAEITTQRNELKKRKEFQDATFMKVVDMYFWRLGCNLSKKGDTD